MTIKVMEYAIRGSTLGAKTNTERQPKPSQEDMIIMIAPTDTVNSNHDIE